MDRNPEVIDDETTQARSEAGPGTDMIGVLRAIEAKDLGPVATFLLKVHGLDAASNFDTRVLNWKYLSPRSEWTGSRGFVLEKDGRIIAYGGVLPTVFRLPNGDVCKSVTLIDWAAERSVPGAGVALMSKVLQKAGTIFIIGGTPAARKVLPQIGFRGAGDVTAYARWVRPWKEFWIRRKTPRSALRLAHAVAHSICSKGTFVKDWDSELVNKFDGSLQTLLDRRPGSMTFCQRSVESLNYMLKCPAVEMKGFLLRRKQSVMGYFILGKTGWEGRLVDILVDSDDPQAWELACATATHTITNEPEVCRIFAWATAPPLREGLIKSGFWLQDKKPVMVRDPRNALLGAALDLQLFDGEGAFLTEQRTRRHDRNQLPGRLADH
jgi:hypothetical protein